MWTSLKIKLSKDSRIVSITSGSTSNIKPSDALLLSTNWLIEIAEVHAKEIVLREPWRSSNETVDAKVIPTSGDFNQAVREIRLLREVTADNYSAMESFWTKLGSVTFKSYEDEQFTFKTARQLTENLSATEREMSEATDKAKKLVNDYDENLGQSYQRVMSAAQSAESHAQSAARDNQQAASSAKSARELSSAAESHAQSAARDKQQAASSAQSARESSSVAESHAQSAARDKQQAESSAAAAAESEASTAAALSSVKNPLDKTRNLADLSDLAAAQANIGITNALALSVSQVRLNIRYHPIF